MCVIEPSNNVSVCIGLVVPVIGPHLPKKSAWVTNYWLVGHLIAAI